MNKTKEAEYKRKNKPAACSRLPFEHLIPIRERHSVLLTIKQESLDAYGCELTECPKRRVCFGKTCSGRPLPIESKTAAPLIEKLRQIATVKQGKLFINTDCSTCEIYKSCQHNCNQVSDWINRDKRNEQVDLNRTTTLDNVSHGRTSEVGLGSIFKGLVIPWDCLTPRKRKVVKLYLYSQHDFLHVANELGLYNQAASKYEFYSALTRLSKFANIRLFLKNPNIKISPKQLALLNRAFVNNEPYAKIAKSLGVTPQNVQQTCNRVLKRGKVKWRQYVRREKGKLVYDVPALLK